MKQRRIRKRGKDRRREKKIETELLFTLPTNNKRETNTALGCFRWSTPPTTRQRPSKDTSSCSAWTSKVMKDLGASTRSGHGPYAEFDRRVIARLSHPHHSFNRLVFKLPWSMQCWQKLARMPSSGSPLWRAGGREAGQTEQPSLRTTLQPLQRQSRFINLDDDCRLGV
jgi:hypothetical protein